MELEFPGGPVVESLPVSVGCLIPGPGRFHMMPGNEAHAPHLGSPSA